MFSVKPFLSVMFTMSALFANDIIDDFEDGDGFNQLNRSWYFFSDVTDGGNTVIVNADMASPGNYSACKPVSPGCESRYCMKIEYLLGDSNPFKLSALYDDEDYFCNFAGIGTDLARPGATIDLSNATGISFKARSDDSTDIFIEIVTSTVYDYGYFRKNFLITEKWSDYSVDFFNDDDLKKPFFAENSSDTLNRVKIQKVNWQISRCIHDEDWWDNSEMNYRHGGHGALYLDDIVIHRPVTKISPAASVATIRHKPSRFSCSDLLGREVAAVKAAGIRSGVFLVGNGFTVKPVMLFNGTPVLNK